MSDTNTRIRTPRRGPLTPPNPGAASPPPGQLPAVRAKAAGEISSLIHLAELDARLLERADEPPVPLSRERAHERQGLTARLSPEIVEAYNRALRAGRRPAVVRLVANVCSGCHVSLHSMLEQKVRRRRGVGACPHCLRLVYDPAWLHETPR